jgi:hypothetical protein
VVATPAAMIILSIGTVTAQPSPSPSPSPAPDPQTAAAQSSPSPSPSPAPDPQTAAAQSSPSPSPSPAPHLQGATEVTIDHTNRDCYGNPIESPGSGGGSGFAIINVAAPGGPNAPGRKVIANVVLTNAAPNSSYGVRLIQTPPRVNDCGSYLGPYEATLQTDASGSGHINVQETVLPGADDAFVALNSKTAAAAVDFYTSPHVNFSTGD